MVLDETPPAFYRGVGTTMGV